MKSGWLERIRTVKGGGWLAVLACCVLAALLTPLGTASNPAAMTEEEQRLSATLSRIAGAGETRVSIFYAQPASAFSSAGAEIVGAVIVSRGAGDVGVRLNLLRAAEALLGLGPEQVEVFPMEGSE